MKVKILALGKKDAWYPSRKYIIGNTGEFSPVPSLTYPGGFRAGDFHSDESIHVFETYYTYEKFVFAHVKIHKL